jgi:two-component system, cell cycle response regulator
MQEDKDSKPISYAIAAIDTCSLFWYVLNMQKSAKEYFLRKIESGYSLPVLSPVAAKLIEIASNDMATVQDLASLIEKDPALTVRLLRMANSALFKVGNPVATIEQAIQRIGFDRLRVMALSLSLRDTFPMGKVGTMDYEEYWRTSLYQALMAKAIAKNLRNCNPDEAFVSGLVLEIGLLIFFDLMIKGKGASAELSLHPMKHLIAWEETNYSINHREIGEAALRYWQFPEAVVQCQRYYLFQGKEVDVPPLARVCETARECASLLCQQSMQWHVLFRKATDLYGMSQDLMTDILADTFDEVQDVADSLKVQLKKKKELEDLMKKARATLVKLSAALVMWEKTIARTESQTPQEASGENKAMADEIQGTLATVLSFANRLTASLDKSSEEWKYANLILEESKRLENALTNMKGLQSPR